MTTILGFELGNSTGDIPSSTWEGDGVLEEILSHLTPDQLEVSELELPLVGVYIEPVQEGDQHG